MAYPATTAMSAAEFLAWEEKQLQKHEFIQGKVLAIVGISRQHATVAGYVLINPVKRKTELFWRDATGHWVLHEYDENEPVLFASLELTLPGAVIYENIA